MRNNLAASGGGEATDRNLRYYPAIALLFIALTIQASQQPSVPAVPAPCPVSAQITSIESSSAGLIIAATAPITARIVSSGAVSDAGFAGFAELTVEIPLATLLNVPNQLRWESGLFASMRAVRYRNALDCGIRLRLQPNVVTSWLVHLRPEGVVIAPSDIASLDELSGKTDRDQDATQAGSARAWGSYSATKVEGDETISSSQFQLGAVQNLRRLGTLRGFLSHIEPAQFTSAPYGAIGLSGVDLGAALLDLAWGDVSVATGETGLSEGSFITTLLMRGGGVSILLPRSFGIQGFAGRAAGSSTFRVPGTTGRVSSDITNDWIYGSQLSWRHSSRRWGSALGLVRSEPEEGSDRINFFQSLEMLERRYGARFTLEESRVDQTDATGYALTFEPRANFEQLSLGGFYRYISSDFVPPAASNFFAGLRRSYSLYGNYRPAEKLSASFSLGQSEVFSLFDQPDISTLHTSRGVGIGYQLSSAISTSVDYSESSVKSEPGAILPADSFTTRSGLSASTHSGDTSASIRVSRENTENRISPNLGVESDRIDVDLSRLLESGEIFGHLRYADSRRPNGDPAGSNYGASMGFRLPPDQHGSLRGEIGYSVTPAGLAAADFRQAFASLGFQTGPAFRLFQGGAQVTFQRLYIEGEPARDAASVALNAGRLLEWGRRPIPVAPFYTRAMPLVERGWHESIAARLVVRVFEDIDGDGFRDAGERGVAGVTVRTSYGAAVTNAEGLVETRLEAGETSVEIELPPSMGDLIIERESKIIDIPRFGSVELPFALRPAGRLFGRVVFSGEPGESSVLQGIRIVLRDSVMERQTVTDESGLFRFGLAPSGTYSVSVDPNTLAPETTLVPPGTVPVSLAKGEREEVIFTLRRATARERIIAQVPPAEEPTVVQPPPVVQPLPVVQPSPEPTVVLPPPEPSIPVPTPARIEQDRKTLLETAKTLTEEESFREANETFSKLGELRKGEERYRYYRAIVLYELGHYSEAKRELKAALPFIDVTDTVKHIQAKIEGAIE